MAKKTTPAAKTPAARKPAARKPAARKPAEKQNFFSEKTLNFTQHIIERNKREVTKEEKERVKNLLDK